MADHGIFREAAVERLSSPENLNQVTRVVPRKGWLALACLFVSAAAAVAWICLGRIALQLEARGALLRQGEGAGGEAVAVMAGEEGGDVRAGMEARLTLDSGAILTGTVVAVSGTDGETLVFGALQIPLACFPGRIAGPGDVAALIRLDEGEAEKALESLARDRAQPIGNAAGWFCGVRITLGEFRPIQLILPE